MTTNRMALTCLAFFVNVTNVRSVEQDANYTALDTIGRKGKMCIPQPDGKWSLEVDARPCPSASDRSCQIPDHLAKSLILLVGSFRGACALECKDSLTTL